MISHTFGQFLTTSSSIITLFIKYVSSSNVTEFYTLPIQIIFKSKKMRILYLYYE